MSWRKCAQSVLVRRAVTLVLRHPAKGSLAMNTLHVPKTSILVSRPVARPGAAGIGIRVSPIS